jgi:hypothetical protein
MGGQRKSLLKWSQVPIEPVADGERRIDAGQVPSIQRGQDGAHLVATAAESRVRLQQAKGPWQCDGPG